MDKRITFEIVEDNSKLIKQAAEIQILRALETCGLQAERYAVENITAQDAVDTGFLRNSITHAIAGKTPSKTSYSADKGGRKGSYSGNVGDRDEKAVYIGSNVEYAPYIEYGTGSGTSGGRKTNWTYKDRKDNWHKTGGTAARPYLRPAVADHMDEYKKIIKEELSN